MRQVDGPEFGWVVLGLAGFGRLAIPLLRHQPWWRSVTWGLLRAPINLLAALSILALSWSGGAGGAMFAASHSDLLHNLQQRKIAGTVMRGRDIVPDFADLRVDAAGLSREVAELARPETDRRDSWLEILGQPRPAAHAAVSGRATAKKRSRSTDSPFNSRPGLVTYRSRFQWPPTGSTHRPMPPSGHEADILVPSATLWASSEKSLGAASPAPVVSATSIRSWHWHPHSTLRYYFWERPNAKRSSMRFRLCLNGSNAAGPQRGRQDGNHCPAPMRATSRRVGETRQHGTLIAFPHGVWPVAP